MKQSKELNGDLLTVHIHFHRTLCILVSYITLCILVSYIYMFLTQNESSISDNHSIQSFRFPVNIEELKRTRKSFLRCFVAEAR